MNGLSNLELRWYNGSAGSCPQFLHDSFSSVPRFSLVLDPRGRLERKGGSVCEELEGTESTRPILS